MNSAPNTDSSAELEWELDWLEGHLNRETGVGIAQGRLDHSPSRMVFDELLDNLDHPEHSFSSILVAGTNAKTTTTWASAALLIESGYRVGAYISPHLESMYERISVDGLSIDQDDLRRALRAICTIEPDLVGPLSWFEIITAAAFIHFKAKRVEVAVVETGLGGKFDATAVLRPSITVITNIDLDHTHQFGSTRADIAHSEASILDLDTMLVLGESDRSLRKTFTSQVLKPPIILGEDYAAENLLRTSVGLTFDVITPISRYDKIKSHLQGRHQTHAVASAIVAAELFAGTLDQTKVENALDKLQLPGRFEVRYHRSVIVLDGAHNPAGARILKLSLKDTFRRESLIFVVGCSKDKPVLEILSSLITSTDVRIVCCAADTVRSLSPREVACAAKALGIPPGNIVVSSSVAKAMEDALCMARMEDVVVVTGSLYVVGEARLWLNSKQNIV